MPKDLLKLEEIRVFNLIILVDKEIINYFSKLMDFASNILTRLISSSNYYKDHNIIRINISYFM